MFQRFHAMREQREGGFTLIELLVVVLIVAILAAVAIPVFLRQREKGYKDQSQSALKNAATALESYATDNNGNYPATAQVTDASGAFAANATATALDDEGFNPTADVQVDFVNNADGTWCMEADHASLPAASTFTYDSVQGEPVEDGGTC